LTNTGYQVLNTDTLAAGLCTENPGLALSPDTLASILYTSGSTGRPKGVVQNHRNILHHGMRVINGFHISADDRMALLASLSTGQAQTVMYYALLNGATLYRRHVKEEGLTLLAA
jgi:long-subunit acyl-CoA synthetase (AMP-forming)